MAMRKAGRRSTENGMFRALRTRNRDGPVAPDKPDDDDGGAGDTLGVAGESDYVAPDEAKARRWIEKAAEQGFTRAQYNMGKIERDGICLAVKPVGEPHAGNPQVRFDERGGVTGRCRMAQATAPLLDSTWREK